MNHGNIQIISLHLSLAFCPFSQVISLPLCGHARDISSLPVKSTSELNAWLIYSETSFDLLTFALLCVSVYNIWVGIG